MKTESRAALSTAEINDLPDSAFAYIEPGGKTDDDGKTTPRRLRHYPVHDKAHAKNALSRAATALEGDDEDAKAIAKKAMPKIKAAAEKFGIDVSKNASHFLAEKRVAAMSTEDAESYGDTMDMLSTAVSEKWVTNPKSDYAWVCDFGPDWVVFSLNGEKQQASWTLDGETIELGDASPVRAKTVYVPIETKGGTSTSEIRESLGLAPVADAGARLSNFATAKRAFSSLVEQPPPQSVALEVRMDDEATDPQTAQFKGYAYTIDERYDVSDWLGIYSERIGPGASSKTLREQSSIPLLLNHDGLPMANTSSRTSQLSDDGHGLLNLAALDRRQALTNDVCIALQRKDIDKMSFSFRAINESWNDAWDDRYVTELQLYDTSIVTYPANPGTTAELQEAMRAALGREGRSLWLADSELSVRSALPAFIERREMPDDGDELLERALRALAHADEIVCRSHGQHGRARTFQLASVMFDMRAGKALSTKNSQLLQNALDALSAADKQHQKLAASHSKAADAVSAVLNGSGGTDADSDKGSSGKSSKSGKTAGQPTSDGKSHGTPPAAGDPINPGDGAGPRSAALKLQRQREAEIRAIRRR